MRGPLRWALWLGLLALTTVGLVAFRTRLDKSHIALLYLLLVLGGSVGGGRALGFTIAALAFFLFNWLFLAPYGTLAIANPLDWLVLAAFLVVGTVSAQLLHRLQAEAEEARRRAQEVDRLAALGAETLGVVRADDALVAITSTIQSALGVGECRMHLPPAEEGPGADGLIAWVARNGRAAARLDDGTTRLAESAAWGADEPGVRTLLLPLQVRDRTVGVLELTSGQAFALDAAQRRLLSALAYYAALGLERVRLAREVERVEALREADRLKDALLASVSHDLRTPLTTIKAHAHELAAGGDERAMAIEEEADRLTRLVADLLELSRLQGGSLRLALEPNAVDDVVGAALQRVAGPLAGREVRVTLEEGGTMLVGRFDFVHTLRVLVNLLENAAKYSPHDAPIDLTARRAGNLVEIAVADRGPGVPAAERERIFEAFYRPPGTPADVGGSGLGLAIARRLAEAQGGSLTLEPRAGGGSVFTVALPAADLPAAPFSARPGL
jgi:two-component system sensor histidine kinase KdpD